MIPSVHSYIDADMSHVQDSVARWIDEVGPCGYDHIGELPHRIYENLRSRQPVGELVHVWRNDSEIVGVSIALRFGSSFDALVAPALRGTDVERAMVQHATAVTARFIDDRGEHFIGTDVFDCDEQRIAILDALGFDRFRTWDDVNEREVSIAGAGIALPEGFTLRSATPADADQLAQARNSAFDEDWTGAQYKAAVMDKPGYDANREIIAVAPSGTVAAFAVYWLDDLNKTGHFEPVGTHKDFQRMGLARAVMSRALQQMQKRGITRVTVNHDEENEAARRLYSSLGFKKCNQTFGYRLPATDVPENWRRAS